MGSNKLISSARYKGMCEMLNGQVDPAMFSTETAKSKIKIRNNTIVAWSLLAGGIAMTAASLTDVNRFYVSVLVPFASVPFFMASAKKRAALM